MRLHFCEACRQQFTTEGELPQGAELCPACREKQGAPPPAKPGRTNTLLRASTTRGSHRQRLSSRTPGNERGKAGLSPTVVWGGIALLIAMIGVLLLAAYLMNSPDPTAKESVRPPQGKESSTTTPPAPPPEVKQDSKADEAAFNQLLDALAKLRADDRAGRLAKLEEYVKRYPDAIQAARARIMIGELQGKPDAKNGQPNSKENRSVPTSQDPRK